MKLLMKVVWILAIVANLVSLLWFLLGATANFQRSMDIISTFILMYFGIPSILLTLLSVICLIKRWYPSTFMGYTGWMLLICCMLLLTPTLIENVNPKAWLTENVTSDSVQITADGRYEYRLEIINLFQKNGSARLYLKNRTDGNEIRVPLDLPVQQIKVLEINDVTHWISLTLINNEGLYLLRTDSEFVLPNYTYRLDARKGSATILSEGKKR